MKKIYLCLAAALTLGLAACSSSSDDTENKQTETTEIITPVKTAEVAFSTNGNNITRVAPEKFQADDIFRQYGQYVQTNLEIDDQKTGIQGVGLSVHLSVHIRAGVNPVITLAIPQEWYNKNGISGTKASTYKYYAADGSAAAGTAVAVAYDTDSITITVSGMDNAILGQLENQMRKKKNTESEEVTSNAADGLTIDIRLYMNDKSTQTVAGLKNLLEGSGSYITIPAGSYYFTGNSVKQTVVNYVVAKGYKYTKNGDEMIIRKGEFANGACELRLREITTYEKKNFKNFTDALTWMCVYSANGAKNPDSDPLHPVARLEDVTTDTANEYSF